MELISKVSKGSRMDQIYIPKKRADFPVGCYVMIKKLETKKEDIKIFFHNIGYLEPIKVKIIKEVFKAVEADNVIITGSFLDKGFEFNDIDIIIISEEKPDLNYIEKTLKDSLGVNTHLIAITNKALIKGISTDPLYKIMLSKYVSKKRIIYKPKTRINYKLLDLHLLKSNALIDNFDFLTGKEKYEMTRNLVSINLFINKKQLVNIDLSINNCFGSKTVERLKNNLISKKEFLYKYKKIYENTKNKILEGIKNEQK